MKMIENIIFLGKEKPLPDRYLNYNLIKELDNLVFENKCKNNEHNIVFAKYEVNNNSSFFDMIPGICSCGLYWKKLANHEHIKNYFSKNKHL
ncbi:MAG: hypothetical protein QXK76_00545 [Candidatus Woesearchaeota archaeon]